MRYTVKKTFRMDDETYKQLLLQKENMGKETSISECLRELVFSKPSDHIEFRKQIRDLQNEVSRVGNNVNQIAKNMNVALYTERDRECLFKSMKEIQNRMDDIYKLYTGGENYGNYEDD